MSYNNPRIKDLTMSTVEIIQAMAEGNPGAVTVLMLLVKNAEAIDPDSALGAFGAICHLDTLDIYGSRIWMFYKDVCGCDLNKMMGVMRANQMGFVPQGNIASAIDGDKSSLDIPALLAQVKAALPRFIITEGE